MKKLYLDPTTSDKKSFHSFRHSFSTALKDADVSETVVKELLGHAHGSLSFDRYGKPLDPQKTAWEGIDRLDYEVDFVKILGTEGANDL